MLVPQFKEKILIMDLRNRYKITCSKLFPKPLKRLGILKTKDQVILEPILISFKTEIRRLQFRYYFLLALDGICFFLGIFSFLIMIAGGLNASGLLIFDLHLVIIILSVSLGGSLVLGLVSRKSFKTALVSADQRLGWKDRVTTAFQCHGDDSLYRDSLVRDALDHIQSLDPKQILPFTLPKSFYCFLLFSLVAGAVNLMGSPPTGDPIVFSRSSPELEEIARQIEGLGKQLFSKQEKEDQNSITNQIRKTARQMAGAAQTPEGAVRSLSGLFDLIHRKIGNDIRDLEEKMGQNQASPDIIAPSLGPAHPQPGRRRSSRIAFDDLKKRIEEAFDKGVPEDLGDALEDIENQLALQDFLKNAIQDLANKGGDNRTADAEPDLPPQASLEGKGKANADRGNPAAELSGPGQGEEAGLQKVSDHEKELAGTLSYPNPKKSDRIKPNPSAPVKDEIGKFEGGAFRASIRAITAPGFSLKTEKEIQKIYIRQKEEILLKEPVPVEYKAVIRDYFLSIGLEKE